MKQSEPKSTTTWEWLAERLPLLNIAELCRRAEVPRGRIADAQRGRQKLNQDDLDRLGTVVRSLR